MQKIRITAIAPYEGLKDLIAAIGKEQNDMEIKSQVGNLENGIDLAMQAERDGADIIISRGGTTLMIKDRVSIPVIDIEVSGYDLLRILTLAKSYPGKSAIVAFPNIIEGSVSICSLLNINMDTFTVNSEKEVSEKIYKLAAESYQVIIGDVVTINKAKKMGLNGILLTSGRESVLRALNEAKKISKSIEKYKSQAAFYKSIIKNSSKGCLVVSSGGKILYQNDKIEKKPDDIKYPEINELASHVINKGNISTLIKNKETIWKVNGYKFIHESEPMAALNFKKVNILSKSMQEGISIKHSAGRAVNGFPGLDGSSPAIKETLEKAKKYSNMDLPLWIYGEIGTGKDSIAYYIHSCSRFGENTFVTLDCKKISDDCWRKIMQDADKIYNQDFKGTIYFKRIECLPNNIEKKLISYMQQIYMKGQSRFIVSSKESPESLLEKQQFDSEFYYILSRLNLYVPPLRERKADIDILVSMFINDNNIKYGKQIAGILESAVKKLKEYNWPGNISQLKQVIEELVISAEGPYINQQDVGNSMIYYYKGKDTVEYCDIDLNCTLDEIEKQIIKRVLMEEGMNQSKTAQRLGINRSTLWRKLK